MVNEDEIVNKLLNKEIRLYQIEEFTDSIDESINIRRKFIEKISGSTLDNVSNYSLNMDEALKKNIENPIGTIQIPLGVVGPLKINGNHINDKVYVPLATTEGALVASINRGCSVITDSGGVSVQIIDDKMTRAPAIQAQSVKEAFNIKKWIQENFEQIKETAEKTTNHGRLIKIDPIIIVGRYVYPRFVYTTGDSMGMNMVTIATETALDIIIENSGGHEVTLSSNVCTDKKPAAMNLIEGRGKSIVAEINISKEIVEKKLKTTPEAIVEVNMVKNFLGSAIAGSLGFNAHFANTIGAIFLATGQDEAHIVEGSLGITSAEVIDDNLYFSVTIPDLPIATIGGGTCIETAQECLDILGVSGSNNVNKFGEIIGGTVLAGELSLMGALAAGHLAKAHKELGRG